MRLFDHPYSTLVGRILLGAIFLLSGINKIADPAGTQGYMAAMGMTWGTTLFYLGATLIEVGGGLSLWLGYWTRTGAALLIGFMIPTTLIFHTNFADPNQMIHFMKNLAMTGGLLYLATYGPGPMSLDRRLSGGIELGAREDTASMRRRASA
jgi:putative oxidoreductase